MSTNTIKSIKIDIKNKKVFITSSVKNIFPKYYSCDHCPYYDKFFNEENAIEKIKKDILYSFFNGTFKGLSTNYGKAISTFKYVGDCYEIWDKCRKDPEFKINFDNQLLNHFNEYEAKRKCKRVFNIKVSQGWIAKLTTNGAKTSTNQDLAKKFNLAVAETNLKRFSQHGAKMVEIKN
jgi:hypothetical protein